MKVYLAQMKPLLGAVEKNAEKHYAELEKAIAAGAELAVFPELSLTGYYLRDLVSDVAIRLDHPIITKLKEYSQRISIAFGFVYESDDNRMYNAAAYLEDGAFVHIHKKVYLPDYTMFEEGRYFAAGESFEVFKTKFGPFGMLVCEDSLHVSSHYMLARGGALTILVLANSPARGVTSERLESENVWDTSNRAMALLHTVNLVFVNRTGVEDGITFWGGSRVYCPGGIAKGTQPLFEETGAVVDIDVEAIRRVRITDPYLRDEKEYILKKFLNRRDGV